MIHTGEYFERLSSKSLEAEINLTGKTAQVKIGSHVLKENMTIKSIQNKQNIHFEDGSLFVLNGQLGAEEFSQASSRFENAISWLEHFTFKRAAVLAAILIVAAIGYRILLSSFVPIAVSFIPDSWERKMGESAYESMLAVALDPSELSNGQTERLKTKAAELLEVSELADTVEINFHNSKLFGANALAFPGGPIVVTDDLVKLLEDDLEVLSVIAHEIAHIKERHALHQIVEVLGLTVFASILFGASETLIEEGAAIAIELWAFDLSRDMEKEADLLGVEILLDSGIDPVHFSNALTKLTLHYCKQASASQVMECVENESSSWFSTHPTGADRLKYLNPSK